MQNRPSEFKDKSIILGVKINDQPMDFVLQKISHALESKKTLKIYTPNPEICLQAEHDHAFRHILNQADINIPDGVGLKYGAKILGEKLKNRVTGSDLTRQILDSYSEPVYIVLRDDSLTKPKDIEQLFKQKYPNIKFKVGIIKKSDPYNADEILNDINKFEPRILFVCLGAPHQETWIHRFIKIIPSVNVALGVGGSFDFLSGKIKRAPKILKDNGLEWAYRLSQEPARLKRIKNAVADFLLTCHKWKKNIEKVYRTNVVGIVKNKHGEFLIQKNARLPNHWQFPQGGVDEGESPEQAVIREVAEEVGVKESLLRIIKKIPETHVYDWPPYAQLLKGYKGQQQEAFLLEFIGSDKDFDFSDSHEVEEIKWVSKQDILKNIHPVRREFGSKIVKHI